MKRVCLSLPFLLFTGSTFLQGQVIDDTISENETSRIIHVLASDSFKGRGNMQPGLLHAGKFIGEEFRKSGLHPLPGFPGYFLPFYPGKEREKKDALTWNGSSLSQDRFLYLPLVPGSYAVKSLSEFTVMRVDSFFTADVLTAYAHLKKDLLLWTDKKQPGGEIIFPAILKPPLQGLQQNVLLVYADKAPDSILLAALPAYSELEYNVVGVIPGRSKAGEVVLFSAHYDHMGVLSRRRSKKDSIMNGANDNASGTTALLMLAHYFAKRNDNERTLIFCAFAGEEVGLKGSKNFIQYIDPDKIIAGINIEMIGIPQYGERVVFITGEEYSSLPRILKKNFGEDIRCVREPDPEYKQLFARSDNFSFARKGIPSHSIMASDDADNCYHAVCDEVSRIDIQNMTVIIRGIAAATATLINGKETPERINYKF